MVIIIIMVMRETDKNVQLSNIVTQVPMTTRKPSLRTEQKSLEWI